MIQTLKERLYSKLEKSEAGCLIFTGGKNKAGYGNIYIYSEGRKTITKTAHRVAWEIINGPIANNQFILHHCDNPSCCNPEHLFIGTQADNMQDKSKKGRAKPGPSSKSEWWTPDRREARKQLTTKWKKDKKELLAANCGVPVDWKLCPLCKTWKPKNIFGSNRARSDGLQSCCKPCKHERDIERVRRNKGITSPRKKTRSDKKSY